MTMRSPGHALDFPVPCAASRDVAGGMPSTVEAPGQTDAELMASLCSNDSTALRILFDRYSRLALHVAQQVVQDRGEAEDVVQDAFFYVYSKAALFNPAKGSARGWIAQIAFSRALDKKSHLTRRGFYKNAGIDSLDNHLLADADLDREIASRLNRVLLDKAFEELPLAQRQTLEMFYFEGLGLREISRKLNEPVGNTRHHFYRGLERLRKSVFVQKLQQNKP